MLYVRVYASCFIAREKMEAHNLLDWVQPAAPGWAIYSNPFFYFVRYSTVVALNGSRDVFPFIARGLSLRPVSVSVHIADT